MQTMKKYLCAASLLSASLWINSGLSAMWCVESWNDLSVSGGWRTDKVHETNIFKKDGSTFLKDHMTGKHLNIWEVGGQLHLSVPQEYSQCSDNWWVNGFFMRGNVYWGWITHGRFRDFKPITTDINRAKVRGTTFDGTAGLGYLFPICNFAFGPVGGYSYDRIRFKLRDAQTDGTSNHDLVDTHYRTSWQGPWIGADTSYRLMWDDYSLKFEAGYEYHWATFNAHFETEDENFNQFSFHAHSHSHKGHGNLVYLNTWWNFWDCLDLGLGFKYQIWRAHKGEVDADYIEDNGGGDSHLRHANWRSFGITMDLGYDF